ncbi:hypothetical protein AJ79_02476 [Helicocarpus griseus UAMH5409]|uniref:Fungal-type protein kinase domain-containing protein n=1 Tax=Helicocarpus griseus UAMH5409 TaxID=1447875 RepID=A0A2B7Y2M7_9EURO|nr:hypothetical protein AJ79_02476 [Helicocarpus griseus UAMH5409]
MKISKGAMSGSLERDLNDCVFCHVSGFYEKYFEGKTWSAAAEQAMQKVPSTLAGDLCLDFLEIRSVTFIDADGKLEKFYLENKPIAAPQHIVGISTTCYPARRLFVKEPEFVVKFSWGRSKPHTERELLELMEERNVWGAPEILWCQDLGSIRDFRQGLKFTTEPYDFSCDIIRVAPDQKLSPEVMRAPQIPAQPIDLEFDTMLEFLEACRDVVKVIQSLHQDGKALHRNICIKNLAIVPKRKKRDPRGILINFDSALDLQRGLATKGELVGSREFMAIGILTGDSHTYRHDLESLFYVSLWVAICNDREQDDRKSLRWQPKTSRLCGWCSKDFGTVARNKTTDMKPKGFSAILEEFSWEFKHLKGLAKELRQSLFPMQNGELFTGTDIDRNGVGDLYDGMIDAFSRSIAFQVHE